MKKTKDLPLLTGPLYAPDGTKCADWWELAEWFRKQEGPLWQSARERLNSNGQMKDTAGRRLREQAAAYRDAYETIRLIAQNQVHEVEL